MSLAYSVYRSKDITVTWNMLWNLNISINWIYFSKWERLSQLVGISTAATWAFKTLISPTIRIIAITVTLVSFSSSDISFSLVISNKVDLRNLQISEITWWIRPGHNSQWHLSFCSPFFTQVNKEKKERLLIQSFPGIHLFPLFTILEHQLWTQQDYFP